MSIASRCSRITGEGRSLSNSFDAWANAQTRKEEAQLVEHCTGIVEVTGSNPVEALIFSRFLLSNLNWKLYCDDHSSLSFTTAVQIWIISYKLHSVVIDGNCIYNELGCSVILHLRQGARFLEGPRKAV